MAPKTSLILLLVVVFVGSTYSSIVLPPLCNGVATKCKAKASLKLFVFGKGHCTGSAAGKCSAIAKATRRCIDIVDKDFFAKKCFKFDIAKYARCAAVAIASVFTQTNAHVSCTGKKAFGCAWSKAEGRAFACSYALALVDLVVKIKGHKDPICEAQVGALAQVFATAASKSSSDVCVRNKSKSDFDKDFAAAIEGAVVRAFARCWGKCDGSEVDVDGGAGSKIKSSVVIKGDGSSAGVGGGH